MEAGRELDFLVSTHVMGMVAFKGALGCWFENTPDEEDVAHVLPHYSSDMVAAWRVVERMETLGFHMDMLRYVGGRADVRFVSGDGGGVCGLRPVPEAICHAALAAVGHPLPQEGK